MTIAKGIIEIDDWCRFGQLYDELGEYAYLITYVPKKNELLVSMPAEAVDSVLAICFRYGLPVTKVTKGRGTMMFIKFRW